MAEMRNITYRLLPRTAAKSRSLSRLAGACRYVWSEMFAQQEELYRAAKATDSSAPYLSFFTLGRAFTKLREPTPWLQELPFAPVRYVLKYQADAWKAYFGEGRGRPRFKARRGDDGFTIPDSVRIFNGSLHVPRLGWYVLRRRGGNPYPDGMPKQARVKGIFGKWYCTVSHEVDLPEKTDSGLAIGVDRDVGQIALSTGDIIPLPDTSKLEARKKRYHRMVARRKKGSNRRKRAVQLARRTSRAIANVRKDWCHQTSRMLADAASEIVVEYLNTEGMTASAKGTTEQPGKNVQQKAGLNRGILESGWGELEQDLGYKAFELTKIPAPYTSQTCNMCGLIDISNRRTQAEFRCVGCGHHANADVNAALNILASGIGASGQRGALGLPTPMNRQQTA